MGDDSAEILFQSSLQEALVSSSGMGRNVHSLTLSTQHFLCRPRRRPPSKGALKDNFGQAVVACDMPDSCKFPSLNSTVSRRGSCGPTREFILLRTKSFVCAPGRDAEKFSRAFGFEGLDFFLSHQARSMFHSCRGG